MKMSNTKVKKSDILKEEKKALTDKDAIKYMNKRIKLAVSKES